MFLTPSTNHLVRVVVADDEQGFLRGVGRALQALGVEITLCDNGDQALQCCRDQHVDVLLADVAMPGVCGEDLLRAASEVSPATVVILMTGKATVQSAV